MATAIADAGKTLVKAREELSTLEGEVNRRQSFRFDDKADGFLHKTLRGVEKDLLAFLGKKGALSDVEARLSWAKGIEALTLGHPKARVTWEQARRPLSMRAANRIYQEAVDDYANRHRAKPGITGWAEIGG